MHKASSGNKTPFSLLNAAKGRKRAKHPAKPNTPVRRCELKRCRPTTKQSKPARQKRVESFAKRCPTKRVVLTHIGAISHIAAVNSPRLQRCVMNRVCASKSAGSQ